MSSSSRRNNGWRLSLWSPSASGNDSSSNVDSTRLARLLPSELKDRGWDGRRTDGVRITSWGSGGETTRRKGGALFTRVCVSGLDGKFSKGLGNSSGSIASMVVGSMESGSEDTWRSEVRGFAYDSEVGLLLLLLGWDAGSGIVAATRSDVASSPGSPIPSVVVGSSEMGSGNKVVGVSVVEDSSSVELMVVKSERLELVGSKGLNPDAGVLRS